MALADHRDQRVAGYMTQDVEIDDQGLFIGFQVEPRATARTCG